MISQEKQAKILNILQQSDSTAYIEYVDDDSVFISTSRVNEIALKDVGFHNAITFNIGNGYRVFFRVNAIMSYEEITSLYNSLQGV